MQDLSTWWWSWLNIFSSCFRWLANGSSLLIYHNWALELHKNHMAHHLAGRNSLRTVLTVDTVLHLFTSGPLGFPLTWLASCFWEWISLCIFSRFTSCIVVGSSLHRSKPCSIGVGKLLPIVRLFILRFHVLQQSTSKPHLRGESWFTFLLIPRKSAYGLPLLPFPFISRPILSFPCCHILGGNHLGGKARRAQARSSKADLESFSTQSSSNLLYNHCGSPHVFETSSRYRLMSSGRLNFPYESSSLFLPGISSLSSSKDVILKPSFHYKCYMFGPTQSKTSLIDRDSLCIALRRSHLSMGGHHLIYPIPYH